MEFQKKLKKYLEEHGIKQKFVAEKAGIQENVFSMMLNGQRKMYVEDFYSVVKALNLDVNEFFKED